MATGLWTRLSAPVLRDPAEFLRRQLANRENNFLDSVRTAIFQNPENPYHQMFRSADCAYSDLEASVRRDGLDSTLGRLLDAGVYLSQAEFKGSQPIVRNGREFPAGPEPFRNRAVTSGTMGQSGGSRSQGTKFRRSAKMMAHSEAQIQLRVREFGSGARHCVVVRPILPGAAGLAAVMINRRLGRPVDRWFSPTGRSADSAHYWFATRLMVGICWMRGVRVPRPRLLPANDFSQVSAWIARRRSEGKACEITSAASPAARIAAAALDHGHDIRGTLFFAGGEALTDAKRDVIEAAGGIVHPGYWISELGPIGFSCRQMTEGDCVHLFSDSVAVVGRRKPAPFTDAIVNSLHFTTLLPYSSFVLVNAEFDDAAEIAPAACDCEFSRVGFHTALQDIASFGKLTGYGMTLVGSDIVKILESVLPQRFGGRPTDYQITESPGETGTSIRLLVSPRVPETPLDDIRDCFLRELRRYGGGALASRLWKDVAAFSAVRAEPHVTSAGKIPPLHLTTPEERRARAARV